METNLKSQLSSTLVAKMVLPEIIYMQVATWVVKKALIDLKTTFTVKDNNANHLASPTLVEATKLLWI